MPFEKIATVPELPADSVIEVTVRGEQYAICNAGGNISALWGVCPHAGGPLGQGQISGGRVVCPYHAWSSTAARARTISILPRACLLMKWKVEGEDIFADLP